LPATPDSFVREQDGSGTREFDDKCDDKQHRREQDNEERRDDDVEGALDYALATRELGRFDVYQRETSNRTRVNARACDIGEAWGQNEVLLAGLKRPGEFFEATRGKIAGTCDGECVSVRCDHCLDNCGHVTYDGRAIDDFARRGPWHARTYDGISGAEIAPQFPRDLGHRRA